MKLSSIVPVPNRVSTPAKLYIFGSVLNGFANGVWSVVRQLYLISLGFDGDALGSIFMVYPIGAVLTTIPAGILADRYGKKRIVVPGYILLALTMILFLTAKRIWMFSFIFFLIGLADGMFVVLGPLYSSLFDKEDLDKAFGLIGFFRIILTSIGSLLGFIPPILVSNYSFSTQASYWTIMAFGTAINFIHIPLIIIAVQALKEQKKKGGIKFTLRSKDIVAKFSFIKIISVIGSGSFFSFFPYYVNKKFGVESDSLGILFFASNFVAAGAQAIAPKISKRLGTLITIVTVLGLCTPFYLMIPLSPNFTWLSTAYIILQFFGPLSNPLTSSLFYKLLYNDEKATANSIISMVSRGSNIVAPKLGGCLMQQVSLDAPAFLVTGLRPLIVASYYFLLRNEKEKGE